ncbi:response regulator transcription factor [Paenibacillus mucilaginosus]|nr:LuxR C-terminal-related transcriptional regulator [Paenibacillus mucilaginosus]MCG7215354.1 LuxR C-terminal-related transcriptional regulator [Paenibacillus mucilaginosus]WDM27014.1 response regulator transcription factor [Paenibacillus mucilaginosus]
MESILSVQSDIKIVGSLVSPILTIRPFEQLEVDMIIIGLPSLTDSFQELKDFISELHVQPQVIVTSQSADQQSLRKLMYSYLTFHLFKNQIDQLTTMVRFLYYHSCPLHMLLQDYRRLKQEEKLRILTKSERSILEMVSQGYKQREIADELQVSLQTIKLHINRILKKFGARNCQQALKKLQNSEE